MSVTIRSTVKMKLDLMLEDWIFFCKLSHFMTLGENELSKSVIHIWPPQ
jgi:hypothetical protein